MILIFYGNFQNIKYSSSAAKPKPRNIIEDERITTNNNNNNEVKITKISLQDLHKLQQSQLPHEGTITQTIQKTTAKKTDELPWRITPSPDFNQLMNHYLMLSKFRLTCKEIY